MKLDKMKKEDLELLSNKELTTLILKETKKPKTTADLFKKIMELLELPESTFEDKIAEFYTQLATDKNFTFLDNGKWDLSINHKRGNTTDEDEEDEDEEDEEEKEELDMEEDEDNYDDTDDTDDYDDTEDDLKDLVIIDEDELELDN